MLPAHPVVVGRRPLPDGNVLAHFLVEITAPIGRTRDVHLGLFPKVVAEMVSNYKVAEFDFSITRGQWQQDRWGYSPMPSAQGASLTAWLEPGILDDILVGVNASDREQEGDARASLWQGLTHALAGYYGLPLDFVASPTNFVRPTHPSTPWSGLLRRRQEHADAGASQPFHGSLPREAACTENLTPWLRLLPCRAEAGLGKLLKAHRLCGALFSSYTAHVVVDCRIPAGASGCPDGAAFLRFSQTVTTVTNAMQAHLQLHPASSPDDYRPSTRVLPPGSAVTSSLKGLFGEEVASGCPLASSSFLRLHVPAHYSLGRSLEYLTWSAPGMAPERAPAVQELGDEEGTLVTLDLSPTYELEARTPAVRLSFTWALMRPEMLFSNSAASFITAHSWIAGGGSDRGTLVLQIRNGHANSPARLEVSQALPWYVRLRLHTLRVLVNGLPAASPFAAGGHATAQLGDLRRGMSMLEYSMHLAAGSTATVRVSFDKAYLHLEEHRPDPNSGLDLPSPAVSFRWGPPHRAAKGSGPAPSAAPAACFPSAEGKKRTSAAPLGATERCLHQGLEHDCTAWAGWADERVVDSAPFRKASCLGVSQSEQRCGAGLLLCVRPVEGPVMGSPLLVGLDWPAAAAGRRVGPAVVTVYGESTLLQVLPGHPSLHIRQHLPFPPRRPPPPRARCAALPAAASLSNCNIKTGNAFAIACVPRAQQQAMTVRPRRAGRHTRLLHALQRHHHHLHRHRALLRQPLQHPHPHAAQASPNWGVGQAVCPVPAAEQAGPANNAAPGRRRARR